MEKGIKAEYDLADIVAEPLLMDFVQLKPFCKEGKKYRELCDLLIENNFLVVPVELKMQDKEKAKPSRNEKKWAQKKLQEASNQINGAIQNLKVSEVITMHPYRGVLKYEPNKLKPQFGLVIVDYNLEPFEIDGELPRRSKSGVPIHYLSHNDFIIICQKLMTLPDLLDYFEKRSKIPAWAAPKFNDERNFYAYYLVNPYKISYSIQKEDYKDYWKKLETEFLENYNEKVREDEKVEVFNHILHILCTVEPIKIGSEPPYVKTITKLNDPDRLAVTKILNSLSRLHRREIISKIFEKLEKAETKPSGFSYFAYRTEDEGTYFLFVSSKNDRQHRKIELELLAHCLNTITPANKIVGIATESKNVPDGRSYDFIYLEDFPKDLDPEFVKEAKNYFKDFEKDIKYDFPKKSSLII
jgi:hypothetical protein